MNPFGRIGVPGLAISPNGSQSYQLLSGAAFILPAGNFLAKLGPQTAIQFKDYYTGLWRTFDTGAQNSAVPVVSDGTNFRAINLSGTISGVGPITPGTLYSQATATAVFGAPAAGTPSVTAAATPIVGGSLSLAVAAGGSNYSNPLIIMPDPTSLGGTNGFCIGATATATLTAGVISGVTVGYAGAGYTSVPTAAPAGVTTTITPAQFAANMSYWLNQTFIVIVDPTGSGALLTCTITNGNSTSGGITGLIMTNNGAGYDGTHIPSVTFGGATGSGASATALPWMALKSITVAGTNTGYTANAVIETSLSSGAGPIAVFDDIPSIRPARAIAVPAAGVLAAPIVEDAGGGFQTVPLAKQLGNATADGSVNATFVAVVGGVTNNLILMQVG